MLCGIMALRLEIEQSLNRLKPSKTVLVNSEGSVFEETRNEKGEFSKIKVSSIPYGFVVDTKPNLEVSKVLPWLYLGAQDVVYDSYLLTAHDISLVLSIGVDHETLPVAVSVFFIDVYDLPEFDIYSIFKLCIDIIECIRNQNRKLYVHCNAGVSRSPTVVLAYLMYYFKIGYIEALSMLKRIRPSIKPNQGFVEQLKKFEHYQKDLPIGDGNRNL